MLHRSISFPKCLHVYMQNKNERTICCVWENVAWYWCSFYFSSLFLSPSFFLLPCHPSTLDVQVLDASSPVPDVNEDSLEHDAPPQEPQQPGAITAPQELDGQQAEVASPLEGLSGEQAEAAGTNGKWKPVFNALTVEAWMLNGMRSWNGAQLANS